MNEEPKVKRLDIDGIQMELDWLIYRSYEFNRKNSPHISPERWRAVYINQPTYEKIFQGVNHE